MNSFIACASFLASAVTIASLDALAADKEKLLWRNSWADENRRWGMNELHWFDQEVNPSYSQKFLGSPGTGYEIVTTSDFDRDGNTDLFWRNQTTGRNLIWLMNGAVRLSVSSLYVADPTWTVVGSGDFNGDGFNDVLWTNGPKYVIWYMNGASYDRWDFLPVVTDPSWQLKAVADFNGDTNPDIFLQNPSHRLLGVWYLNGTNLIGTSVLEGAYPNPPGNNDWVPAGVGCLNLMGNSDLYWRNSANHETAVWTMRNNQKIREARLPKMPFADWRLVGNGDSYPNTGRALSGFATGSNIVLAWRINPPDRPSIYRREFGTASWGSPLAVNYLPSRFTNSVTPGIRYEYKVGAGSIVAANADRPVEHRGKVILIAAKSVTNTLAIELEMFRTNLVGDGWTVIRRDVPDHSDSNWSSNVPNMAAIKSFIVNVWNTSPSTNLPQAVILIGHIPIPHSGLLNPDGHGERGLPADGYYGDVDGVFTDTTVHQPCAIATMSCGCEPRHDNFIGDGRWDQNRWPPNSGGVGALELAVGRIDCANLPIFTNATYVSSLKGEIDLLRQYLNKNDKYRRKVVSPSQRVLTGTYFAQNDQSISMIRDGIRIGSRLFGLSPDKIINGDGFFPENGSLWAVNGGFGSPRHMQGSNNLFHATSLDVNGDVTFIAPQNEPQGGFFSIHGSCLMDFQYSDQLMRSLMAVNSAFNYGVMWYPAVAGGGMLLQFERIALGDTVGSCFVQSVNETTSNNVYLSWMGDPTLRLQILAPAKDLLVSTNQNDVILSWSNSPESLKYFVYRSTNNLDGPFHRISGVVEGTRFVDGTAPIATNTYMVRALELRITGSGSFTNLSQGVFATIQLQ